MSVDVARFHETFFEESLEGLATMESGLLLLAAAVDAPPDADTINEVFRAAHSIKGGSGMFGFEELSGFTHFLETLLDELRCGKRPVTAEATGLLLNAVDCLRSMLESRRVDSPVDQVRVNAVSERLRLALAEPPSGGKTAVSGAKAVAAKRPAVQRWQIRFQPHLHFFRTGNDPARLLKELSALGTCAIQSNTAAVPPLASIEPEDCYLAWDIELTGEIAEPQIREVFDWVEGDCDLSITACGDEAASPSGTSDTAENRMENRGGKQDGK